MTGSMQPIATYVVETAGFDAMSENINRLIASKIDGYLWGVTSFSGQIRDYTGYCFVVEVHPGVAVSDAIRQQFGWCNPFDFAEVRELSAGLGDLESMIRPFLIREARGLSPEDIEDLQHYLSFRVMDMVSDALGETSVGRVLRLDLASSPGSSEVTFFAVEGGREALILQFNNDIPFKRKVEDEGVEVSSS